MHATRRDTAAGSTVWARLVVVLLARAYRAVLLTLTLIAVAPLLLGWGSYVVESGSMEPSIAVGDVVLARPAELDDRVRVGRVYVFDDPAHADRLLVHRIVERRDEGGFTTAGDANAFTDTTPIEESDIRAQAILLVPHVGLPVHWIRTGQWLQLSLWLLLTIAAFVLATRRLDSEPPRWRPRRWNGRTSARPRRAVPVAAVTAMMVLGAATTGTAGAAFTDQTASGSNRWTVGTFVQKYVAAVLTDQPYGFWLLDEAAGSAYGADRSGNNRTAQYYDSLTLGRPGGLPTNPGTAVRTSGGRVVMGPQAVSAPNAYSIELWFRTTSRAGGFLAGFENDRDGNWLGGTADRIVSVETSGQLTFGVWGLRTTGLTTSRAYNDGVWHHLVVTSTSARATTIYVDGAAVSSGTTVAPSSYTGYWRIGQGSTGLFNGLTGTFDGEIDNVSIFHSVLSSTRVAAHWAAR